MLVPRPGILDIAPYVGGRSSAGERPVTKLSSNESALGPSPKALAAYRAIEGLHRYPDGGSTLLREALARHHGIDAARIVCGNGSDELLSLLTRAYAGPGDEVLFPRHGFLMYRISALTVGATPVIADETDLKPDVDALLAAVTARTRVVFLANPGNPTGTYIPASEVKRLQAGLPDNVLLVVDSAYAEFCEAEDYEAGRALVDAHPNVVMTRTFSKLYGLAGLRLGWAYAQAGVVDVLNRLRGPFDVSLPAQLAGVAALEDTDFAEQVVRHTTRERDWLYATLSQLGLEVVPSVTNFILIRFGTEPGRSAADADRFLTERGFLLRRVDSYELPQYLRLTIGTEAEDRAVAEAIRDFVRQAG
ncbi:histidinol-phosphate transaminase [Zavarzinia sp. CC-PAN008]|uniref:histidinol-phosphate transaminase n=1 Tax=Zavarzinia sp. CC-PAN008 TaxID=3243332 RepID=UPI003F742281